MSVKIIYMEKLFKGKKITIMGLGLHGGGVGVAKFFCQQDADVLVTDLKTKEQLKESLKKLKKYKNIKYRLGEHKKEDFVNADLVIKNPDVPNDSPFLEVARKNNVSIKTDISIFFDLCQAPIIGVTGTKGKSTVATLIYELLKTKYKNTILAGNIGVSPLEFLNKINSRPHQKFGSGWVVLELSSFELEGLAKSPQVAVITNILPDHLNRYANMERYIQAKKTIFKYQKSRDTLILNKDNFIVRQFAGEAASKVYFFSLKELPKGIKLDNFKLLGNHNLSNLLAAIKVAEVLKIPPKNIEKSLKTFKGLASRQEFVGEIRGVKYFNDTTATMPEATIAAIRVFSEEFPESKLILICGGVDKRLKYGELAKIIKEKVGELIMLPGTASDKIKENLVSYLNMHEISSMSEAVEKSSKLAKKGDIVLLSPGAASFNLFKNEFDRGNQFIKEVKKIK